MSVRWFSTQETPRRRSENQTPLLHLAGAALLPTPYRRGWHSVVTRPPGCYEQRGQWIWPRTSPPSPSPTPQRTAPPSLEQGSRLFLFHLAVRSSEIALLKVRSTPAGSWCVPVPQRCAQAWQIPQHIAPSTDSCCERALYGSAGVPALSRSPSFLREVPLDSGAPGMS